MKNYTFILTALVMSSLILVGAGCKKSSSNPVDQSDTSVLEEVTSSAKFPGTNLEYYLQSYREHVLPVNQKLDKKKMKAVMTVTGIDQANKQSITVTLYSDAQWNDGKEHIFDIEEVEATSTKQFGQFSSVIKNLVAESGKIPNGKVVGDFLEVRSIKVVSK